LPRVDVVAQLAMSNCEWMFGDVATGALGFSEFAHFNPLRWSGPVAFEKAIKDLEEVLNKDGSRAIIVKVPANASKHHSFETIEEAMAHLQKKNPVLLAQKQDEEKSASGAEKAALAAKDAAEVAVGATRKEVSINDEVVTQAKDDSKAANDAANEAKTHADKVQSELVCTWMFGDAGKGLLGFNVAKLNPLRWSGNVSLEEAISQLQTVHSQAPDRQIVAKLGVDAAAEQRFQNVGEALAHLECACPLRTNAKAELEAATGKQKEVEAKLIDAEKNAADVQAKLQSAMDHLSSAEADLEEAKKKAAQAKAELDEMTSAP